MLERTVQTPNAAEPALLNSKYQHPVGKEFDCLQPPPTGTECSCFQQVPEVRLTPGDYFAWRQYNTSFPEMRAFAKILQAFNLSGDGKLQRIQ